MRTSTSRPAIRPAGHDDRAHTPTIARCHERAAQDRAAPTRTAAGRAGGARPRRGHSRPTGEIVEIRLSAKLAAAIAEIDARDVAPLDAIRAQPAHAARAATVTVERRTAERWNVPGVAGRR